nr:mediator of RNA polymerase II transcription subunit 1-like isoform X1 [Onthophagus taurus]
MSKIANVAGMDRSKDWQLELLMEKLRSKSSQYKTLPEMSKSVRMTILDTRFALDSVDKSQHQKCLDTLQHSIKVTSLQSMVERLESLTRQLGLKFVQGPKGVELFISSDMFYLEIILDQTGAVLDVKVHHDGKSEQQSCKELVNCLSKGDFSDFTAQLEGFASIYQLNAEKKIKSKAFTALQSLETDLSTLSQLQMFMKEPFNLLHKSPVGILEKRRGGHPMKLTYFVSPYDLINLDKFDVDPMTIETVTLKKLGYSVTVCMEGSAAHKLQTTTLITVNKNHNGKNTPSYALLSNNNSAVIPACFVLKLNKPMPICATLIRQIYQITELECADLTNTQPLLGLITLHSSNGKMDTASNKGLFVTLPDQSHCYFMTENRTLDGLLINSIPFTHPGHVAQILVILRQQALFNTIISSCVRPNSKEDLEEMIMFEISALSWTQISISLEHPIEESMATAEIDLSDISMLSCRIHSPGSPPPINAPDVITEMATKHLNKSFSIPVTMRSVIRLWEKQLSRKSHFNGHENFNLPLGSGDPGGRGNHQGGGLADFSNLESKMKQESSHSSGINLPMLSHHNQAGMFLNETLMSSDNFSNFSTSNDGSAMLTNVELTNILSGGNDKPKRLKRKDDWKSSKRKGEDDLLDASSCDSTSRSTPLSQETCSEIPTPNSALGFHSDFESLDPSELISDKSEYDNVEDIDVEEILLGNSKFRKKSPTLELESKISPSVSITPISSSSFSQNLISMSTNSSITITPIPMKTDERNRSDKKSSKTRSEDKNRLDKKRKRKREESPMGPPEKIPLKEGNKLIIRLLGNMFYRQLAAKTYFL